MKDGKSTPAWQAGVGPAKHFPDRVDSRQNERSVLLGHGDPDQVRIFEYWSLNQDSFPHPDHRLDIALCRFQRL